MLLFLVYGYVYVIPDPPLICVSRTCVCDYVCTLTWYRLKNKEVSTALTLVLRASLNRVGIGAVARLVEEVLLAYLRAGPAFH